MTPGEVKALSITEYIAFLKLMRDEIREQNRAARKRSK